MRQLDAALPIIAISGGGKAMNVDFLTAAKAFGTNRNDGPESHAVILVVEDSAGVRQVVTNALASFGHRVLEAHDAQSAFAILQEDRPIDLLFTDIVMPGSLSDVQLAERAKELRPEIKVLLTSGFAKVAMENAPCGRPAGPLLSKPYRMQDLAQAVSDILHGSGEETRSKGQ